MNKTYNTVTQKIKQYHRKFRFEQHLHINLLKALRKSLECLRNNEEITTAEYVASLKAIFAYCTSHFSNLTTFNILYD